MNSYAIKFENVSDMEANKYAAELGEFLSEITPNIQISQERANARTQDAGTILQIILGSGAAVSIAKGIADWLRKRPGTSLEITNDAVSAKNISSSDAVKLTEIFVNKKQAD